VRGNDLKNHFTEEIASVIKERQKNDDRDRHAEKPKQYSATHECSPVGKNRRLLNRRRQNSFRTIRSSGNFLRACARFVKLMCQIRPEAAGQLSECALIQEASAARRTILMVEPSGRLSIQKLFDAASALRLLT
jgi:hypothetical protein